jgi:tetratricopeptide (TPR) repeat protein
MASWPQLLAQAGEPDISDYAAALFCAQKAADTAGSDIEWASAKEVCGIALFDLGKLNEAISAITMIAERFAASMEIDRLRSQARALINKGLALGVLGRNEEEIAVYDDVLARFATAPELPLREAVARTLVSKGFTLGERGRSEEEIAVYDDVLAAKPQLPRLLAEIEAADGETGREIESCGQKKRAIPKLALCLTDQRSGLLRALVSAPRVVVALYAATKTGAGAPMRPISIRNHCRYENRTARPARSRRVSPPAKKCPPESL